jgi:uncharacterized protein (TIGR02266 family)
MARDPNKGEIVARYASATVEELIAKHALDVSEGGMLLRSSCSLPTGKLVNFEVRLSNEEVVLSGAGRIAWKRDAPDADRPAGVAVRFVDLDDGSQALVDRLLAAKGNAVGEFDRAPGPSETAKTVLGLGSPFLGEASAAPEPVGAGSLPSADETRGRTKLGFSPVVLTPREKARVGTRLGLAPPVAPASLVLGDQSSPSVEARPTRLEEATSDIDAGWGDEAKTGNQEATPASTLPPEAAARISQIPTVEVKVTSLSELRDLVANTAADPEEGGRAPAAVGQPPRELPQPRPQRQQASEVVDPTGAVPRRRAWVWIMLLLAVSAFGVYEYESSGESSESSSDEAASPVAPPEPSTPAAAKSASPVVTTGSSTAPSAVTTDSSTATSVVAHEESRAIPSAASPSPIAPPDAGRHHAASKPSASTTATRAAPSPSETAKPRVPPKPIGAEDNPY